MNPYCSYSRILFTGLDIEIISYTRIKHVKTFCTINTSFAQKRFSTIQTPRNCTEFAINIQNGRGLVFQTANAYINTLMVSDMLLFFFSAKKETSESYLILCSTKVFNAPLFFSIASAISFKGSPSLISEFDHNLNTGIQSL